MAAKTCAACGKKADGKFCSWCGAALEGTHCSACGSKLEPGARFCNACGAAAGAAGGAAPVAPARAGGGGRPPGGGKTAPGGGASQGGEPSRLVWGVAAVFIFGMVLAVAIPAVLRQEEASRTPVTAAPGQGGAPVAGQGAGAVDLSSMTPRQRADALYDRIMSASSSGDSTNAAFFLPMGMQAYDMARPLDADGLFHLSLLQRMANDPESGLATAREALTVQPNHLLNLMSAAGAAAEMGDTATARDYYQQYLDVYDEERARALPEYEAHDRMFGDLTAEAEAFLAGA